MRTQLSSSDTVQLKPEPKTGSYFVARQPILTGDQKVFGYELLFRDGVENYFGDVDREAASRSTLDSTLLMGFDVLCDGRRAFVNCTRSVLLQELPMLLPRASTVVEVLETVPADDDVIAACKRLKDAGYTIALDDFCADDPRELLIGLADIIKVDIRTTTPEASGAIIKKCKSPRCRVLAEKVETPMEFSAAQKAGFQLFQGYFFRKPEVLSTTALPANQVNYLRMLQAASRPELDSREIENVIKSEASLCYRLLRYLNSAAFGFASEIHSVRHALSMLGEKETRRWMRLVATLAAGQNKTSDLVISALIRARFCELLAARVQQDDANLFLMGLFSLMDAILGVPMARLLEDVPVAREIKAVLSGEATRLRPIYLLMLAQEAGEWEQAEALAAALRLDPIEAAEKHWQAMRWARELSSH